MSYGIRAVLSLLCTFVIHIMVISMYWKEMYILKIFSHYKVKVVPSLNVSLFGFLSVAVNLEEDNDEDRKKILGELFAIRHALSEFYFFYQRQSEIVDAMYDEEDALAELITSSFNLAHDTCVKLGDILFKSDLFLSADKKYKEQLVEIFDYIYYWNAIMDTDDEVPNDEIEPIIKQLVELYEGVNDLINKNPYFLIEDKV